MLFRSRDSICQKAFFQLAQTLFAPAIGEGDQRMNEDSALRGVYEGPFDLRTIKAEDHDFNAFFGLLYAFDQSLHAVAGLDK